MPKLKNPACIVAREFDPELSVTNCLQLSIYLSSYEITVLDVIHVPASQNARRHPLRARQYVKEHASRKQLCHLIRI